METDPKDEEQPREPISPGQPLRPDPGGLQTIGGTMETKAPEDHSESH